MSEPDYKAKVLEVWPDAKVYHTANLCGVIKVYHIGRIENKVINCFAPSYQFAGNKQKAWQYAYNALKQQGKI